jgi:WD40 repeat protein
MSELVLMPTPNWFISKPLDISFDGTIAFSAINSVLITNVSFDKYKYTIKDAHSKRIHSLSFYYTIIDNEKQKLLATCSEDLEVKVWNLETKCILNQHKFHQVIFNNKIRYLIFYKLLFPFLQRITPFVLIG